MHTCPCRQKSEASSRILEAVAVAIGSCKQQLIPKTIARPVVLFLIAIGVRMLSSAVIAMSLMTQTAVAKMAVVRTFATNDEIGHLTKSITEWDAMMPCAEPATSQVDLILVYSKDIGTNPQARAAVEAYEASFAQGQNWTGCFAGRTCLQGSWLRRISTMSTGIP